MHTRVMMMMMMMMVMMMMRSNHTVRGMGRGGRDGRGAASGGWRVPSDTEVVYRCGLLFHLLFLSFRGGWNA